MATVEFTGNSKTKYSFNIYDIGTEFKSVGGIYCFTVRTEDSTGNATHKIIYIGITDDLSTRFDNHHKADCIEKNKANRICIYQETKEARRKEIEADLIANYKPTCNEQLK